MLKPARDYENELNTKLYCHFYDKKNQWQYSGEDNKKRIKVEKVDRKIQFVSVDNDGNFNGLISCSLYEKEKALIALILISFNNNNPMLMKDLITFFYKAYKEYGNTSISYAIYRDAPFYPQALRLMNKFATPEIKKSDKRYKLADGLLHYLDRFTLRADTVDFEKLEKFLRLDKENNGKTEKTIESDVAG